MATPEQWARIEDWAKLGSNRDACVLELRSRVEDLEATLYDVRCNYVRLVNAVAKFASNRMEFYGALHPPDVCEEESIAKYYEALAAQHQGQAVFHGNSKPTPNDRQIGSSDHFVDVTEMVEDDDHPSLTAQERNPNLK